MIKTFYYLRETRPAKPKRNKKKQKDGKHRCGIVSLVKRDGLIGRGISLLNEEEDSFLKNPGFFFDRRKCEVVPFEGGLKKAEKRALKAINSKKTSEAINLQPALRKVSDFGFMYKSYFNPTLSQFERSLIEKEELRTKPNMDQKNK